MSRFLVISLVGLFIVTNLYAQPSVTHSTPQAVAPGKTTEVTIHGAKLDGALKVWTSFPAQVEVVVDPKVSNAVKCKFTLDANQGVHVGGLVVGNEKGVSDPIAVMVDDLASVSDTANNSMSAAQEVALPIAVDGLSNGASGDYYKFVAKANQQVSIEVIAQRMISSFDPVVRLLDSQGNELAAADDDEALGADCRLMHTIAADGEYFLEVLDNRFAAGGRYRLRIGDFPIVSTPFPLGARIGSTARFQFAGMSTDAADQIVEFKQFSAGTQVALSAKRPGGTASAMGHVVVSDMPEFIDLEPNDDVATATSLVMPGGISGRFEKPNDIDTYAFPAVKGQRLTFDAVSRSVGSPAIVAMRVLKPDGGALGQTSASDDDEESLSVTIPADGIYHLVAEDLLGRGGNAYTYRIAVTQGPSFQLSIKNDAKLPTKFHLFAGNGAFGIDVQCARIGYDGPIQLELVGNPKGLKLFNAEVPTKATAHRVIVAVDSEAQLGDLRAFQLQGRATDGTSSVTRRVSTTAHLRAKKPLMAYPAGWMDGLFASAVGAAGNPYFATTWDKPSVQVSQGASVEVSLKLERKDKNFKAGITILPQNLPAGVTHAVKQDKDTYKITLTATANAAVGNHTLRFLSYGDLNNRGQLVPIELPVEVTTPAGVAAMK